MIQKKGEFFLLETKNTGYYIRILPTGHMEHLYYGKRLNPDSELASLTTDTQFGVGNALVYNQNSRNLFLETCCLEVSSLQKGDLREPMVELIYPDKTSCSDFLYDSFEICKGKQGLVTLPSSYGTDEEVTTLKITLKDRNYGVDLVMSYSVFYDSDVISRQNTIINHGDGVIHVKRLMSTQLDFDDADYEFVSFHGAWAREMDLVSRPIREGRIVIDSKTGTSSNRANPFVMLRKIGASETSGECYGFNLIYSGNHYESVEVNAYEQTRILSGINPAFFSWGLANGEFLESPEAVMTYSDAGDEGMSHHMHDFIRKHIVRGEWKEKLRPILLNSWEANYFKFDESNLLKLAKEAKNVGVELFVLDDGWFKGRNDDTSSLGDWVADTKKLPGGLTRLANKVNALGLQFGIWVEPEMISENSDLYRNHPEYAVGIIGREQAIGRNQMLLDLTQKKVRDYVIKQMEQLFESASISYVKWDMNRIFSDYYSNALSSEQQEEFAHRYMIGLYEVLEYLTKKFPHILFESCASGGNRFDLGMLCYMPQIWASDNTDAVSRVKIQTGYSYGYPMSVLGAHVSACPNHQTLRDTSLSTRFSVACFGLLGYELNLGELSKTELNEMKEQIAWYKRNRDVLQFGTYYRIKSGKDGKYIWNVTADNQSKAISCYFITNYRPNYTKARLWIRGLNPDREYTLTNYEIKHNIKKFGDLINTVSPVHIRPNSVIHQTVAHFYQLPGEKEEHNVCGDLLCYAGIKLKEGFAALGLDESTRVMTDYDARLYIAEIKRK